MEEEWESPSESTESDWISSSDPRIIQTPRVFPEGCGPGIPMNAADLRWFYGREFFENSENFSEKTEKAENSSVKTEKVENSSEKAENYSVKTEMRNM